jgi:hypothetical protein
MHYRRKDDGGVVAMHGNETAEYNPTNPDWDTGDWVWRSGAP